MESTLPEPELIGGATPKFLPIPAQTVLKAAQAVVQIMFPDLDEARKVEVINHITVLLIAVGIFEERGRKYAPFGWMKRGYENNYFHLQDKVDRIKDAIISRHTHGEALNLFQLDDVVDTINYAAFFIRNATDGNKSGRTSQASSGRIRKARR